MFRQTNPTTFGIYLPDNANLECHLIYIGKYDMKHVSGSIFILPPGRLKTLFPQEDDRQLLESSSAL